MFSDPIANHLYLRLGNLYLVLALVWLTVVPAALLAVLVFLSRRPRPSVAVRIVLGLAIGLWASECWLCIPYVGVYPNLPARLLGLLLFGHSTIGQEVVIHAVNATLWPAGMVVLLGARRNFPTPMRVKPHQHESSPTVRPPEPIRSRPSARSVQGCERCPHSPSARGQG